MKVILLKDVRKIGKKFDVKDVSDGYALNFLIPNKLAEIATDKTQKKLEALKATHAATAKVHEDLLLKNLKSLEGVVLNLVEPANEKGSLFKGVHKEEIIEALKKQTELDMGADYLVMEKPIKEVGEHAIEVKIQDKTASFKVNISAK